MLNVYKNEVLTETGILQAEVRKRELDYYSTNYWTWCGTATIFAGFMFDQLKNRTPDGTNVWLEFIYLVFTAGCLGLNLCVITWTAFLCIWGPGLAIRGGQGMKSFHDSIEFLQGEQLYIYWVFNLAIVCFFGSACCLVWVFPSNEAVNISSMVIFGIALLAIVGIQSVLSARLKYADIPFNVTDGRIVAFDQFSHIGDLDNATTQMRNDRFNATTQMRSDRSRGRSSGHTSAGAFSW